MLKSNNPYFKWRDDSGETPRFFVRFKDGQAVMQEIEIPEALYQAFDDFRKDEKRQRTSFERHIEYAELTDESLNNRARHKPESVEDIILARERTEEYRRALSELTEIQRRRFVLYYEYGLKQREIAELEGCGANAVHHSIAQAKTKIRKKLEA